VEELRPGLWTWTAPHPEWRPKDGGPEGWEQAVRCYAVGSVLVDPLDPPSGLTPTAVVLTVRWHERSAASLGLPIHLPSGSRKQLPNAQRYSAGDELPGGIEAVAGFSRSEPFLWLPAHRALVAGDVLLADDAGGIRLEPDSWMPKRMRAGAAAPRLRHLLDLPVELFLPTHGDPVVEAATDRLRAALA